MTEADPLADESYVTKSWQERWKPTPNAGISEVQRVDNMKVAYETMLGLAAEMVLDEAQRKYRIEKIYKAIDDALTHGDSEKFMRLTDELKTFGS